MASFWIENKGRTFKLFYFNVLYSSILFKLMPLNLMNRLNHSSMHSDGLHSYSRKSSNLSISWEYGIHFWVTLLVFRYLSLNQTPRQTFRIKLILSLQNYRGFTLSFWLIICYMAKIFFWRICFFGSVAQCYFAWKANC